MSPTTNISRRPSNIRVRQLDISNKIRIIRSQDDLKDIKIDNIHKDSNKLRFSDLVQLTEEKVPLIKNRIKNKDIVIPIIKRLKDYDNEISDDYVLPTSYIRFQADLWLLDKYKTNDSSLDVPSKIDVNLELKDYKWLKEHPKFGINCDPRYQLDINIFERMIDLLEKESGLLNTGTNNSDVISYTQAEELLRNKKIKLSQSNSSLITSTLYSEVYNYWVQRRNELKRPFLQQYWPQTPLNDTNPHLVFRPREKEKYKLRRQRKSYIDTADNYFKMKNLRNGMLMMKLIFEKIKTREKIKKRIFDVLEEEKLQTIYELTNRSGIVRKPKILNETEKELKLKKKLKKNKKNKREYLDDISYLTNVDNGLDGSPIKKTNKINNDTNENISKNEPSLPSFLEYDTNLFTAHIRQKSYEPSFEVYPPPLIESFTETFMRPPKFICRGRVGRGGRLIIDRLPIPITEKNQPNEILSRPCLYDENYYYYNKIYEENIKKQNEINNKNVAINHQHHHGIIENVYVNGSTNVMSLSDPTNNKVISLKKLHEIYSMNDSEEEIIELSNLIKNDKNNKNENHSIKRKKIKFSLHL